ncbi:MAG: trigger factor [Patescibacteria group bacterium]
MSVEIIKIENSRVEIKGAIDTHVFDSYILKTTTRVVADAELDGFRKGKAPEKMVVDKVGEDKILQESAEAALQHEWPKVLAEQKIEAIGPAEFHITKIARGNPLEWTARVAVMPDITLPDWRGIAHEVNSKKETPTLEVTEKEITDTLTYIQRVRTPEGTTPPPIDDAYAQTLGSFSTLAALQDNIKQGILEEKNSKARDAHRMRLIEEIAKAATVEIPEIMIDAEQTKMVDELRHSIEEMGLVWSEYLAHLKKPETEIRAGFKEDAARRVCVSLTLREIAHKESTEATTDEVTKRVEVMLRPYEEKDRAQIDRGRVEEYAKGVLRNEKVIELLEIQ